MNHKLALRFVDEGLRVLRTGRPLVGDKLANFKNGSAFLIADSESQAKKKTSKKKTSNKTEGGA